MSRVVYPKRASEPYGDGGTAVVGVRAMIRSLVRSNRFCNCTSARSATQVPPPASVGRAKGTSYTAATAKRQIAAPVARPRRLRRTLLKSHHVRSPKSSNATGVILPGQRVSVESRVGRAEDEP